MRKTGLALAAFGALAVFLSGCGSGVGGVWHVITGHVLMSSVPRGTGGGSSASSGSGGSGSGGSGGYGY